jgi:diadenosine tetraphosphatase ApaH/serine/threonine PP2A family protein phosphatase
LTLLAIFADIHANREALDACLAEARVQGAERFVFLGDLVGYGADPGYVVDLVAQCRAEGAIVVKGNHDAAIGEKRDTMNALAREAIDWTRGRLSRAQKDFLAALPLTAELGETLFVHAEAANPGAWIYVTGPLEAERSLRASAKRVTICGHVHCPQLYRKAAQNWPVGVIPTAGQPIVLDEELKWLAVLGSVGQPRDDIPAAAYTLYDDARALITFERVAYDIEGAAQKIKDAGLPAILAARLFMGR